MAHNLEQIVQQLNDHEKRITILEKGGIQTTDLGTGKGKQPALAEIIKGKDFKSGQEKIGVIVGYYEKILKRQPLTEVELKEGWKNGKFDGKYANTLLSRAIKDGYVRSIDGSLDLSQTGEKFFSKFLTNEPTNPTPK